MLDVFLWPLTVPSFFLPLILRVWVSSWAAHCLLKHTSAMSIDLCIFSYAILIIFAHRLHRTAMSFTSPSWFHLIMTIAVLSLFWSSKTFWSQMSSMVQNSAVCIVTRTPSIDHITPVLQQRHWLPVKCCILISRFFFWPLKSFITCCSSSVSFWTPQSQILLCHSTHYTICPLDYRGV